MSGIYIKGMEMPTSCFYCPFRRKVNPDDIMCIVTREVFEETFAGTIEHRNRGNCPLIPVPDHGRLIEADRIELYMQDEWMNNELSNGDWVLFRERLNEVPTIIPADTAEEEVD